VCPPKQYGPEAADTDAVLMAISAVGIGEGDRFMVTAQDDANYERVPRHRSRPAILQGWRLLVVMALG